MKTPTYENLRYELLRFWHFCSEFSPTTWREALAEYTCPSEQPCAIAAWFSGLPQREQRAMRKRLACDMLAAEQQGVKYRAPRGHAALANRS